MADKFDGLAVATLFHNTYEALAPSFGYETRLDTKEFDPNTPNGQLMQAVCRKVLDDLAQEMGYVDIEQVFAYASLYKPNVADLATKKGSVVDLFDKATG